MTIMLDLRCSVRLMLAVTMLTSFGQNAIHGSEPVSSPSSVLTMVRQVGKLRSQQDPSVNETKELAIKLSAVVGQAKGDFREALRVYQAAALAFGDLRDKAAKVLADIKSAPDKPDVLLLKRWLIVTEKNLKNRRELVWQQMAITNEYGSLVPISTWGCDRNRYLDAPSPSKIRRGESHPPAPPVPMLPVCTALLEVADLFDKMGQRKEAINAYLQAIYSRGSLMRNYYTPDIGRAWLRVAALERQEGHPSLALRAYLRAAAVSDETLEPARKGLMELESGAKPAESVPTQTPDVKKSLQRIMSLYCKMNLHPLALRLAAQWKEKGIDLSDDVKTINEEWQEIIRKRVTRKRKYTLGLKMSEVKDWSQVTISLPTETFWIPTKDGK